MKNLLIIDKSWRSYAEQVVPTDATDSQRKDCHRAFFAGAQGLLGGLLATLDADQEPTDADEVLVGNIQAELDQFRADVLSGRA